MDTDIIKSRASTYHLAKGKQHKVVFLPMTVRIATYSYLENPSFIKVLCLTEGCIFEEKWLISVMIYLGYQQEFVIGV